MQTAWQGFKTGKWSESIDVSDFIKQNYVAYDGDEAFLAGPTKKTERVLDLPKRDKKARY